MFLVEAALGKQHSITRDDWTIKAPPAGFDSVVARGQQVGAGRACLCLSSLTSLCFSNFAAA